MKNESTSSEDTPQAPPFIKLGRTLLAGESNAFFGLGRLVPELTLFILYLISFEILQRFSVLSLESYFGTTVIGATASNLVSRPKLGVAAFGILALLIWKRRDLWCDWNSLPHGKALRVILVVAAAALAWPLVTSSFNFLTNQLHGIDRLLLLALFLGMIRKPALAFPFLIVCAPMIWEFRSAWSGYPWEFFGIPLRLITLFATWLVLSSLTKSWRLAPFLFVLLCLIPAHYWGPGYSKLQMGWFWENDISYLLPNSYANGWLAFLEPETIATWASRLSSINPLLILGAIIVEIGSLFVILSRRRGIIGYLLIVVGFHTGIFLISGICLWQWAVVELTIATVLWRSNILKSTPIFSPWYILCSIALISTAPIWLRSANLSWFDGPIKYAYRFEVTDTEGQVWNLPPQFFAPFDKQVSLNMFNYLVEDQAVMGNGQRALRERMTAAQSLSELEALEVEIGAITHNEKSVTAMIWFLNEFLKNHNQDPDKGAWLDYLAPPAGIVNFGRQNNFEGGAVIVQVHLYQVLTYFDGKSYREMRTNKVLEVDISQP